MMLLTFVFVFSVDADLGLGRFDFRFFRKVGIWFVFGFRDLRNSRVKFFEFRDFVK